MAGAGSAQTEQCVPKATAGTHCKEVVGGTTPVKPVTDCKDAAGALGMRTASIDHTPGATAVDPPPNDCHECNEGNGAWCIKSKIMLL